MQRILSNPRDWPLHDAAASRRIEQLALSIVEPHALMQRAGAAVASLARALHPHARSVWIASGPGNNGGDGLEAAIHLQSAGWAVQISLCADTARLPADASRSLQRARAAGVPVTDVPPEAPDVAIDALLGLGSRRAPEGELARHVQRLNTWSSRVLAIDLPSGLNPDTGQPFGGTCVSAAHTLALLTLKPGLCTGNGRDHAGDVWLDTLGVEVSGPATATLNAHRLAASTRSHAQHKGSFGDVAIVGGGPGMLGAALLAARAAHAAGAGRVYVSPLATDAPPLDPLRPELMFRQTWWQGPTSVLENSTVVCGCGGGDAVRTALPRLLSAAGRLVLDADALNAIATDSSMQQLLRARAAYMRGTVITPHPLEAARLLGTTVSDVQANRLAVAQQIAERHACVVVLKGSGTVIAAPGELPWINATGNAALATAGTGDVLAGWLGGWWSSSGVDPIQAARQATWLHGHAADTTTGSPLRAADLIEAMHAASPR